MTSNYNSGPDDFRPLRDRLDGRHQREPAFRAVAPAMRLRPRRRPRPGGSRAVRLLGYLGLGLACLALTATTFLFIADPAQIVRDQLVARVKQATGRDLEIKGATSFTLFPSIGIAMADVSLSPPPGMTGRPTVEMARLDAKLRLMPLLQRKFVVDRLVLTSPVIDLRVDARGRKSWDFAASVNDGSNGSGRIRLAAAHVKDRLNDALPPALRDFATGSGNRSGTGAESPLAMLENLSLDDVRIVDGKLHYTDETQGTRHAVNGVNVVLALKDIVSPFNAIGDLNWRGEKIAFEATLLSLKAVFDQRPAKLTARLWGKPVKASYSGGLTLADSINLDGRLTASSASLARLAKWLGVPLPPASGFGAADLTGWLSVTPGQVYLRKTKLSLDGATANGVIGIETGRPRPLLRADLQIDVLDLNKYLPPDTAVAANRGTSIISGGSRTVTGGPRSIDDLLGKSGAAVKDRPQVRGYKKPKVSGWSNARIDVSSLGLIDTDAKLRLGALRYKNMKAGRTRLKVALRAGRLQADLLDIELYRGRGKGRVTIYGRRGGTALSANVKLSGISVRPLLIDAAGFDQIAGRGTVDLLITGEGASEREIVASLLGNGGLAFTDGALVGINIPQMMRNIQKGNFFGLNKGAASKTDFTELSATFQINNGVASNKDLKMIGPLLRVTGAGKIALLPRRLNYLLRPKLVASLGGQGGRTGLSGFEIPLRIKGPWDSPSITPEFDGIVEDLVKDPAKIIDAAKDLRDKFKGGKVNEALDGLLGKGGTGKAKKLLDQFLR